MERAALVGVRLKGQDPAVARRSLEELKRLLDTAGGRAEAVVTQDLARRDPGTLIGAGKAVEIKDLVERAGLSAVVFDEDLGPGQQRRLESIIPAKIIDRTRLILDIFARRARTREGQLQVELAQLSYLLPRMTDRYGRFEQQTGGIGTRGPGERKLETSKRRIRERMARLKSEMENVRRHRDRQRENRRRTPLPVVALVGYTNAGKSTLLNAVQGGAGPRVYADDKLFATLDPTTRRVRLPSGAWALFSDTVGFIQRLPHHLVAAFGATLEEAAQADLLVHVVDACDPARADHERVVADVLAGLHAEEVPRLTAFNKADRLDAVARRADARAGRLLISAATGEGMPALLSAVEDRLESSRRTREFVLPHTRRDLLPILHRAGRVLSESPAPGGTRVTVTLDDKNWGRLVKELGDKH